jgi:hypothetical protein
MISVGSGRDLPGHATCLRLEYDHLIDRDDSTVCMISVGSGRDLPGHATCLRLEYDDNANTPCMISCPDLPCHVT